MRIEKSKDYPGVYSRDGKKSWSYRAQFSDGSGRWGVSGSGYRTMKEAWGARNDAVALAEAQRGRADKVDPGITLGDWFDYWMISHAGTLRPSSVAAYWANITALKKQPICAVKVKDLDDAHIRRLIGTLRSQDMAYLTLMGRLRTIVVALNAACRKGLIKVNPAYGVQVAATTEPFESTSWDAETSLRFLADRHHADDQLYPAWRLAMVTGLRRGELLGLKRTDLNHAGAGPDFVHVGCELKVRRQRTTVGGRVFDSAPKTAGSNAPIKLDAETCKLLCTTDAGHEYVITTPAGQPWNPLTFYQTFRRACVAAKVPAIRFHDLRHACASLLADKGVPLVVAQARLRHMSPEMTKKYTHALESASQDAADIIGKLLSSPPEEPEELAS